MTDYLVIGVGSAECGFVAELHRRGAETVGILEAGPSEKHPLVSMPFGLVWFRGRKSDFDNWNTPGWTFTDVEHAFEAVYAPLQRMRMEGADTGYGLEPRHWLSWAFARWLYYNGNGGRLASLICEGGAFFNARGTDAEPDVQSHFIPFHLDTLLAGLVLLRAHVRNAVGTAYRQVGTVRLGGLTSDRLAVHGTCGLRVADVSVVPQVTSANTNAPSMMIGSKGAKFIAEDAA